jgi:hypothetical protein
MDVAAWLRELGLEQYVQVFRDNAVDADVLPDLTAEDIKEIGVVAVGDRRRLLRAIADLRPSGGNRPVVGPESELPLTEADGEWRQVTVLFADLSGYTAEPRARG